MVSPKFALMLVAATIVSTTTAWPQQAPMPAEIAACIGIVLFDLWLTTCGFAVRRPATSSSAEGAAATSNGCGASAFGGCAATTVRTIGALTIKR